MKALSTNPHGIIFHWPRAYDALLRMIWGKSEQEYRAFVVELARIGPGQSVLDIGCGTGTLAIAAKRRVGSNGSVTGVDASPQMIARARSKIASHDVDFREATAQSLPFEGSSFDVVLSTTVIHCVAGKDRPHAFAEMARVLRPGGTLLVVDFGGTANAKRSLFGHLNVHKRFDLLEERKAISEAGFVESDSGSLGFSDLHYILAKKAGSAEPGVSAPAPASGDDRTQRATKR